MEVSINGGTPKSSILMGFSTVNHPAIGYPHFQFRIFAQLLMVLRSRCIALFVHVDVLGFGHHLDKHEATIIWKSNHCTTVNAGKTTLVRRFFFTSPTKRHHFVQVPFGIQENSLLFAEKNGAIEAGNQHNPEFCWLNHCWCRFKTCQNHWMNQRFIPAPFQSIVYHHVLHYLTEKKTNKIKKQLGYPRKRKNTYVLLVKTWYMLYGHPSHIGKFCLKFRHNGFNMA